jgi:hypothetical protein
MADMNQWVSDLFDSVHRLRQILADGAGRRLSAEPQNWFQALRISADAENSARRWAAGQYC